MPRAKPLAVLGERPIPVLLEHLHDPLVDESVQHRGNAQFAHSLARLRDVHPSYRLRLVDPVMTTGLSPSRCRACSAHTQVVKATGGMGAAEGVDRIGAVDGPEHLRALHSAGHSAAAGLNHSATDEEIPSAELGVTHTVGPPKGNASTRTASRSSGVSARIPPKDGTQRSMRPSSSCCLRRRCWRSGADDWRPVRRGARGRRRC